MRFDDNFCCSSLEQKCSHSIYELYHRKALLLIFFIIGSLLSPQTFSQPLANGKSKFLGNAITYGSSIPANFANYWNQVTPGNDGKWGSVEGTQGVYNWSNLDKEYNYALSNGFPFKDHNLVWGQQQPSFITSLDSAAQRTEVENWIRACGQRYTLASFVDVVNEPLHAPPPYANALGGNGSTGWDWVITSFQLARQSWAPGVKLLLNDYNIIQDYSATTRYIQIITLLKDRGLIDGIGIQGHYFEFQGSNYAYNVDTLKANLNRIVATGLPIYISEFDINEPNDNTQLASYQKYFPIFWENPAVKGMTLWGYNQNDTWKVDAYLVRTDGSERPALTWLRSYLSNGNFQSFQSGNWNDVNTWSEFNGTSWVHPAPNVPSLTDGAVSILNTHKVSVIAPDTTNKLTIAAGGTLAINSGVNFVVQKGSSAGLMVAGTLENHGTVSKDTSALIIVQNIGKYDHQLNGGAVPVANWVSGSTCQFDSIISTVPANVNQNFSNIIWNCPVQTGNLSLNWNGITISGNITVQNTGSGSVQMCTPSAGTTDTVTITGDVVQSGGKFTANGSNNANTTIVINQNGNINITGGDFSISRGTQGGTGSTIWNLTNGNLSMSNATTQNSTTTLNGAMFVFSKTGRQTLTLGSGNSISSLPIKILSGTTLGAGISVLSGSGFFTLSTGASLESGNAGGLDSLLKTSGTITLSKAANYIFNGSAAQLTGNLLPDSLAGLTINNAAGVTLSKSILVNGNVNMQNGTFSLAGGPLAYGVNGTLVYLGTLAQTTSSAEFPSSGGPKNVTISNSNGVTLHAARQISGNLNLSGNGKFILKDSDFKTSSISNTTRTYYIFTQGTGALKLPYGSTPVLFPVGTKSGYAPVTLSNAGVQDTAGVSVMDDSVAAPYGGRVLARWNISSNSSATLNDSVQLGWIYSFEDNVFKTNMQANSKIFLISSPDTTESGSGTYGYLLSSPVYSVSRGGITKLGAFYVGSFGKPSAVLATPLLVSPVGSTGVPRNALLTWHPSATATLYRVQLANDSAFTSIVVDSTVSDTSLQQAPLTAFTKFFWRVRASNQSSVSDYSVIAGFTTGDQILAVKESNEIPKEFSLSQNYPNPFNPTTVLRYSIPQPGLVSITVYNLLGQKVTTLVNSQQPAGSYEVNFNASGLTSGIYFYRIESGKFSQVKKMLLIK